MFSKEIITDGFLRKHFSQFGGEKSLVILFLHLYFHMD